MPGIATAASGGVTRPSLPDDASAVAAAERLLCLLAPALVIESALLRAVRYLLPAGDADVRTEALAWSHPEQRQHPGVLLRRSPRHPTGQLPVELAALMPDTERIHVEGPSASVGRDRHGLYADVAVEDVTQRFRWIAPGSFLMGLPDSEPERFEDEVQHRVTLTRGYWLADTACTQSLWRAVMGSNPSHFTDDPRNPVEQVSWEDVNAFIEAQRISAWARGPPTDRGPVGVCLPGRDRDALFVRGQHHAGAGQLRR